MIALKSEQTGFFPVSVSTLIPEQSLGIRLYLRESGSSVPRLYRAEEVPFEETDRKRLLSRGVRTLYISSNDHDRYQAYLRSNLSVVLCDERVPVKERFSSLNAVVRDVLAEAFRLGKTDSAVESSQELATHCVEFISRSDSVASELISVLNHDYYTFTHSANVAFYCVLLARSLGIADRDDLHRIAVGGFLHDIGKLDVPEHVLHKPESLSATEFEIVKHHPRIGFQKLCHRADVTRGQLMMVYQHHERLDGGGYPVGCVKRELHDWTRICKVADVYEALTSDRPYRKRLNLSDVFRIMERDSGKAYDEEFLRCWKSAIAKTSSDC